jgi:rifampicin phosphotransferase
MNIHDLDSRQESKQRDIAFVLSLDAIDSTLLPIAGGKAANLGELIHAGFSVPPGFCVTTAAYTQASAEIAPLLAELQALQSRETTRRADLAAAARHALEEVPVPPAVAEAITAAYLALRNGGDGELVPVAVRSSATAEDLPYASFAGQQETYLNIVGVEALLSAVQHCWASLWTERAVSYRESLGLDHRATGIAVVVQRMIDAQVAGVLFTANPLTGKRHQAVIDASPGLGEAIVSGAVNPDHFVITTLTGEIVERRLGDKRLLIQALAGGGTQRIERAAQSDTACLSDDQLRALAERGARVEAHYGAPQDIEWAIDASAVPWLLQARPITTLFPLPANGASTDEAPHAYLSFNVQQGTHLPSTPMGLSALRLLASSIATFLGFPSRDRVQGPPFVTEAASRPYLDVTAALRNSFGRMMLLRSMEEAETHAAAIFQQLAADPRFSLVPAPRLRFFRAAARLLMRTRLPWHLLRALFSPSTGRERLFHLEGALRDAGKVEASASSVDRLAAVEQLFFDTTVRLLNTASSAMVAGMEAFTLAGTLLGDLASVGERQGVLRGLPSNPTTEMTLSLWTLSQQVHIDPATAALVRDTPPARLAEAYRSGNLPPLFQKGLADFLATYGHRSVAELDLGMPRWSEDPTYVLGILASLLQLHKRALSPDAQYRQAAETAEALVAELTGRARRKSWLRGLLVGFCLSRARALMGLRELPRFYLALLLARARTLLRSVGEELAQAGRLEQAEDIFFVTLPEAREALCGTDLRVTVRERRAIYQQELARRHVPLVLLSDGTAPSGKLPAAASAQATLTGTPASPGVVTASARVILDPAGGRLEPGEILVAPSTDPGWTPLFLTAGGLVMETGGSMSHGVIVAREYGIPAVVGLPGATERIPTGSRITIDGTAGTVVILS